MQVLYRTITTRDNAVFTGDWAMMQDMEVVIMVNYCEKCGCEIPEGDILCDECAWEYQEPVKNDD